MKDCNGVEVSESLFTGTDQEVVDLIYETFRIAKGNLEEEEDSE